MESEHLLSNCMIDPVGPLVAAANNTDNNATIINMAGWDGVCFVSEIAVSVNTAVATLTIEGNTTNADPAGAALTGATATATDAGGAALNNKLLIVDVYRPIKQYLQAVRTSSVANITFGPIIAIRYNGKKCPITQSSTNVLASAKVTGV